MAIQRPNILLIMADQMRGDCYGAAGHPDVKTPYLDSLVTKGVRFTNAYTACPSCVPARASLYTGMSQKAYWSCGGIGTVWIGVILIRWPMSYQRWVIIRNASERCMFIRCAVSWVFITSFYMMDISITADIHRSRIVKIKNNDTLILFTSDHGEMLSDHHLFRKSRPYQGSIRIPMILSASRALLGCV